MPIILTCFFLSGFGSLVYESLWTRHLTHVIGGSPYAISIILSVFMGGLGLGGALGGRLADRIGRPGGLLKAYGILEWIIGAYAIALPFLLSLSQPVFAAVYGKFHAVPVLYNGIVFALCGLLLLLPVMCMGATLPLLGKYCVRKSESVGGPLGFLYGLNTLGAALGVVCAGFWLYPTIGLTLTTWSTAALNLAVGVLCVLRGRGENRLASLQVGAPALVAKPATGHSPVGKPAPVPPAPGAVAATSASLPAGFIPALIVFSISGFCAMAYEVIWTKVLTLVMGPTTYSFTLVLAVFITGLALGGWAFGRLSDRLGNPALALAATQGIASMLALFAGHRMGNSLFLFQKIDYLFLDRFGGSLVVKSLFLFVFMLAPAFFLGAAFPLVMRMAARTGDRLGRSIGAAYSVNTLGGVLGAWSAGYILVPRLGSERSLALLAAAQALGAVVLAYYAVRGRGFSPYRWAVAFGPAVLVFLFCFAYPRWNHNTLGKAVDRQLGEELGRAGWMDALFGEHADPPSLIPEAQVYYGDGIGGFTSVWRAVNLLGMPEYSLFVSGKADASSHLDMFTQVLLSQFPMALHPNPRKVMVLGLASGVTAGEALHYPLDRLDVLEINPQVVHASGYFKPWNGDVLAHPKTRLILQDAKAHLLLSGEKYDVIISEPSNPWMAGLAELFTREFFERARAGLNDGGLMVEFIHSYQMDWETFSMVGRTFAQVFPNSMLVRTMPDDRRLPGTASDFLLVGVKGDVFPAFAADSGKIAALGRSRNLRLSDPRLLARLVEAENLAALFGPGPIHTDDLPLLEFSAPKLRFTFDSRVIEGAIASGAILSERTRLLRDSLRADPDSREQFAEYAVSVYKPFPGMMDWTGATADQRQRFRGRLEDYCAGTYVTEWDFLDDAEMKTACSVMQMSALNRTLKTSAGSATTYLAMAEVCLVNGIAGNAYKFYAKALELSGTSSLVHQEARARMEEIRKAYGGTAPGAENPNP